MNTIALTHESISKALADGTPLTHDQSAALLGLVARDRRQQQERDSLVESQAAELERLRVALEVSGEENNALHASLEEARHAPWPEWTTDILKMVREESGYDDDDGVDVAEEVRDLIAEFRAQIARLCSSEPIGVEPVAVVRPGRAADRSTAHHRRRRPRPGLSRGRGVTFQAPWNWTAERAMNSMPEQTRKVMS